MTLVDTSVWIDFFAGRQTSEVEILVSLIEEEEAIACTMVILQELMQGCANDAQARTVEVHFEPFVELFLQRTTYQLAARIYRQCRAQGFIIRSSIDCLVAGSAIEHDCQVLHKDRDFAHITKVCGLKVLAG